jgi:hypothetical protein
MRHAASHEIPQLFPERTPLKIVPLFVALFVAVPAWPSPRHQAAAQSSKPAVPVDPVIDPTAELHTFRLWDKSAPGALGDRAEDIPTLTL